MAAEANFDTDGGLYGLRTDDLALFKKAASHLIDWVSRDEGTEDPLMANVHKSRIAEYQTLVDRINDVLRSRGIDSEEDFYQ